MEKINCIACSAKILSTTAEKNGGKCMPCFRGKSKRNLYETPSKGFGSNSFLDQLAFATGVPRSSLGESAPSSVIGLSYFLSKGSLNQSKGEDAFQKLLQHTSEHAATLSYTPDLKMQHTEELLEVFALVDLVNEVSSGGMYQYFCYSHTVEAALNGFQRLASKDKFELFSYAVGCAKRKRSLPVYNDRSLPAVKSCKANSEYTDLDIGGHFAELEVYIDKELPKIIGNDLHKNRHLYQES